MKKLKIYMNNNGGKFAVMEGVIISILSWGSPIGLSIFLVGLSYFIKNLLSLTKKENPNKE